MELSYEDHYQTSVPLLKCDEELIETLEDHQVNIEATDFEDCMCDLIVQMNNGCKAQEQVLKISFQRGALIVKC